MKIKNFEFKARVSNIESYQEKLLSLNPRYVGEDHQIDTYFCAKEGRLKLREGNIENALINYQRADTSKAKESKIILYKHKPSEALKEILTLQLGVKVIVNKKRQIYFIDNVKFHFDKVEGLGTFLEVEAIDAEEEFTLEQLEEQCNKYFEFFGLTSQDLVDKSYSDLLMEKIEKI
ncbi:class IV adenylate cyclase [Ornithobacterium rhinotracheale]|uniref:class IV adenylate cyclase n=1 Tax=Ornithobacterium rhinotracheale TaxID=28251 RepID=UPI001FF2539D|nr:class IV adenylate cyclase [Ornithobacterium rhinotracheale]MCK0200421.1 class IV adenylate cyclase [Ornithobacterium rhinotracheale]UVD87856.1 class IV adenylate cyclase [Ornithobacterium rhinotracheale]